MTNYQQKLALEGELWGNVAEKTAVPPDWRLHRALRHNVLMHTADIDAFLAHVKPGMRTLELGCASGWLTLAMAQRGAQATGLDISEKAIRIARDYYQSIQNEVSGSADYQVTDLNALDPAPDTYDLIAVKGTLHHLVEMRHVIDHLHQALKPGGLLWVSDKNGDEAPLTVLLTSGLIFLLPTQVSYRDKIGGLLKFGLRAPSRIKASMEAEGLSPFEGVGREHDWLKLIQERFTVEKMAYAPALTGYLTAQVKLPNALALPLLRLIRLGDRLLVRLKILHSTGVVLYARRET
jgi:SAM-dependent methyltransferase